MKHTNLKPDKYLTEQIITYLGNKRSLLGFIDSAVVTVQQEMKKIDISTLDLFSGSGIVARYFKTFSSQLLVNDLEGYSNRINRCYLINKSEFDTNELLYHYTQVQNGITTSGLQTGFIAEMYSPKDDKNIQPGERCFYTSRNAKYLDTARLLLDKIPEPYQSLLIAPLLYEASVKTNTSGFFKAFYKNSTTQTGQFGGNGQHALSRIMADINLQLPVLCDMECKYQIFQKDANQLVREIPYVDLAYLDPPYNQHPYSSNYFMLNLIDTYKKPESLSKISGIPTNWNKSNYNKKSLALNNLKDLINHLRARYVLISFNSDGFISKPEMLNMLSQFGTVRTYTKNYNTFRGCRNLNNRDIYIKEYLYLLKKGD